MHDFILLILVGTVAAALLLDYTVFIARCIRRSRQTTADSRSADLSSATELTVLIPCRNEADHLGAVLEDLRHQSIRVRPIVIDDHSTDGSRDIAESFGVQVIDSDGMGKKAALATGYQTVETPWMATIDADVRVQPNWAACMLQCAQQGETAAALGGVVLTAQPDSGWERFQALEFGSMMVWISGGVATGNLAMGSGANSVYATADYPVNDLHPVQASGDDAFALHSLRKSGKIIRWCGDPEACVHTFPMKSWSALWQQRGRWASKTGEQDLETKRTAVRVGVLHAFGALVTRPSHRHAIAFLDHGGTGFLDGQRSVGWLDDSSGKPTIWTEPAPNGHAYIPTALLPARVGSMVATSGGPCSMEREVCLNFVLKQPSNPRILASYVLRFTFITQSVYAPHACAGEHRMDCRVDSHCASWSEHPA